MITSKAVSVRYDDTRVALAEIDLTIPAGETVVLCGPSGSGKSTYLKMLSGLIPELYPAKLTGTTTINDVLVDEAHFYENMRQIGMVFQNPKTQFFTQDVYSELAFTMENYGVEPVLMREKIAQVTAQLHLERFVDKTMFELSGGQKQLIAFASVCMYAHEVFLLDEPASNLDQATVRKLAIHLHWLKEQGKTIVIAEHRLDYLVDLADRFLVFQEGQMIANLTKAEMLAQDEETLQTYGLRPLTATKLRLRRNDDMIKKAELALHFAHVRYQYRGQQQPALVIDDLTLTNEAPIGLIGNNGAGKSTFAQIVTGLFKSKQGTITLNGTKMTAKKLLQQSYIVMQDVNLQLFFETVEKELRMQVNVAENFNEVVELLQLTPLLQRHPQTLSGGEKQRVAIAAALLSGKKIIVFDEPTSGLDAKNMTEVSALIRRLQAHGLLILVITHDESFLEKTCHRVLTFAEGRIVSDDYLTTFEEE